MDWEKSDTKKGLQVALTYPTFQRPKDMTNWRSSPGKKLTYTAVILGPNTTSQWPYQSSKLGSRWSPKSSKENHVIPCQSPPYLIWNDPLNHFLFVHECGFASIFGRYPLKLKRLAWKFFLCRCRCQFRMPLFCHYFFAWFWLWANLDQYPIIYITGSWTITDQQRRLTARKTFPCEEYLYMCTQKSKLAKTYRLRFRSNTLFQPLQLYWTKATHIQKSATWGILVKPLDYVSFDTKWFVYTLWSGKLSQWCLTCFVWVRLFSWTFDFQVFVASVQSMPSRSEKLWPAVNHISRGPDLWILILQFGGFVQICSFFILCLESTVSEEGFGPCNQCSPSLDWGVWTGTVSGSNIISVVIIVVLILLRPIIILIWLPVQHHDSQLQVVVVDGVVAPDLLLKVQEELLLLVRPWESAWLNRWTLNTFWYEAATSFLPYLWGRETRSSAAQS